MYPQTAHFHALTGMRLSGLASPCAIKDMLEILLFLYRASRAQTPLFFFNTDTFGSISEAKRNLFVTIYKTWAHPANTEPDTSFPVHDKILQGFNCFPYYL
jgi:hypothetical protein